jgi:hypothetical protein
LIYSPKINQSGSLDAAASCPERGTIQTAKAQGCLPAISLQSPEWSASVWEAKVIPYWNALDIYAFCVSLYA